MAIRVELLEGATISVKYINMEEVEAHVIINWKVYQMIKWIPVYNTFLICFRS